MSKILDTTLGVILGVSRTNPRGVGIEIELEAANNMPPREAFEETSWSRQVDGSLRGYDTAEYVLRRPVPVRRANEVVLELKQKLKEHGTQLMDSVRAGTHIHYDVCNLTVREFYTFLCVWYTLEELLSTQFGEGRQGNHFCLRAVDADWVTHLLCSEVGKSRFISTTLRTDNIRYCTLNLTSLFKYCTIEFRALRGSVDNKYVVRWVGILNSVVNNSKLFRTPKDVVTNFSEGGEGGFVRQMLGVEESGLFLSHPLAGEMLRRGVRLAQDIAYAREEW